MQLLEENQLPSDCAVIHEDPEDLARLQSYVDHTMGAEAYRNRPPTPGSHLPKGESRENPHDLSGRNIEPSKEYIETPFRGSGEPRQQRHRREESPEFPRRTETC